MQVWRARCKPLGELVAVKEVDLWAAGDNVVSLTMCECFLCGSMLSENFAEEASSIG